MASHPLSNSIIPCLRTRMPSASPSAVTLVPNGIFGLSYGRLAMGSFFPMDTGAKGKQIEDGVRLMARGSEHIKWPIHLRSVT
ncbi:hypothetical protein ZIOFF_063546 [Zingiber officinale]|uniref:Uncharacterized protein n=1 Tax=Zingiber officinale TaxID=94328 RepID=A0A8J5F6Q2_ZINOF|nr:hypothetical protein ZIOFF_063546 [Zingiber officinale]